MKIRHGKPEAKDHISIQKFLTTTSMMLMVLLLFQSTQVIREYVNQYEENDFAPAEELYLDSAWQGGVINMNAREWSQLGDQPVDMSKGYPASFPHSRIVYVGSQLSREAGVVRQWCQLSKRYLGMTAGWPSLDKVTGVEAVLVSGEMIASGDDVEKLQAMTDAGVHVVICSMPDIALIKENEQLRSIMGIQSVLAAQHQVTGIWVFDGFLLGGEAIYRTNEEQPETMTRQDFNLTLPFFRLSHGTKTYMAATLEPRNLRAEYVPPVIWRRNAGNAYVFVINGDYLSDVAGMGILETLMFDKQDIAVYPVVNAQELSVVGFPTFASENNSVMRTMYGRTQYGMETEVLLPDLVSLGERNLFSLTCFAVPQLDFNDRNTPDNEIYTFFMRQLRSEKIEVGLGYAQRNGDLDIRAQEAAHQAFFDEIDTHYHFRAVYATPTDVMPLAESQGVMTVVSNVSEDYPLVGYLDQETTVQSSIIDVRTISFRDEFRLKSIETMLAYSNATLDMTPVIWPEKDEDEWNIFREQMVINVSTYWNAYDRFDRLTVSQGDGRLRNFCGTETMFRREGNTVTIWVNKPGCFLLLRTHGDTVKNAVGAEVTELEPNVCLLEMRDVVATIELTDTVSYDW